MIFRVEADLFNWFFLPLLLLVLNQLAIADDGICYPLKEQCYPRTSSSGSPAYPNSSSSFQVNPSAVPLEDKFGFEMVRFGNDNAFGLVRGLGRIGAALSPSNGEETFFGPNSFEYDTEYLDRKLTQRKFKSEKISLATAVGVLSNKRTGLNRLELNFGLIGKYNQVSQQILPGYGLMAVLGPFQVGYSYGKDVFLQTDFPDIDVKFEQYGYNVGINMNSVALDYSQMRIRGDQFTPVTVKLITGSLLLERWILTVSSRVETSDRLWFDPEYLALVPQKIKYSRFYGVQYAVFKNLLVGGYYNYYLLNELSAGITLFF